MRAFCASHLLLAMVAATTAADTTIRVPDSPIPAPMPPAPAPAPVPGAPLKLTADVWFVIDSDVPVLILASPDGLVKVNPEESPLRIKGHFIDDPAKKQSRTFKGKHIYTLEPLAAGRCEVLVIPVGATDGKQVVRRTVDVETGHAPQPPPDPKPDPKPQPKPEPLAAKWVIMVEETAQRTPEIARLFGDKAYWDGLKARGISSRWYDKDSPDAKRLRYDAFAAEVGLPAALFLDGTGKVVAKKKVANKTDIDAVLAGGK